MRSVVERFMAKVDTAVDAPCWRWTAALMESGYGMFNLNGATTPAHRAALILLKGVEIPKGKHTDHLCRNRWCVNPDHLEVVTPSENARRGWAAHKPTICKRGHPFGPEGGRCRTCLAASQKQWRERQPRKPKTCWRGHPMTPDNIYVSGKKRRCKTCRRAWGQGRKEAMDRS